MKPPPRAQMKPSRVAVALLITSTSALPARAQQGTQNRDLVRRAVLDYVEGFYEGDSTKFIRSVAPDVFKYGYWIPRDSTKYQGERMTWPEFHAYANRVKASGRPTPATAV